ncbi:MAG: ATP-binding protein [Planctomycetota bacterium]|nr:ATP-binding protein [Planctomycetota bacterium]
MTGARVNIDETAGAAAGRMQTGRTEDSLRLSRTILRFANRGLPRVDFLREVSQVLLDFSGCDAVEVRLSHGGLHYRWEATRRPEEAISFELARWITDKEGIVIPASREDSPLERLCRAVAGRRFDSSRPFFTGNGSFWTGDTAATITLPAEDGTAGATDDLRPGGAYPSLALIRFFVDTGTIGLLQLKCLRPDAFTERDVEFYEGVAQSLGLAVADRRAEAALRERVKELTCLYGIAQIVETRDLSLDEMLQRIVQLLPPAWQYPETTEARIALDDRCFETPGFRQSPHAMSADIVVSGQRRGAVRIVYLEERPEFSAGAFLPEERKLIDAVARDVALTVERKHAEEERGRLQDQLIHADRLATIGQLAAGVAHELNEPLGSILGFAQLVEKSPDLPEQTGKDMKKIIGASLYAREVIKKLMVFARQMPPRIVEVDLNRAVDDGLYFLEARCLKAGITVRRRLAPELPMIAADLAQIGQVFVNLVVNAVQAMPEGGALTIRTQEDDASVILSVQDTGIGMSRDILDKIFLPFFTTKDVDEGTGLGLAVVHGIVSAHRGSIDIDSRPGQGTTFRVRLPVNRAEEPAENAPDGDPS